MPTEAQGAKVGNPNSLRELRLASQQIPAEVVRRSLGEGGLT